MPQGTDQLAALLRPEAIRVALPGSQKADVLDAVIDLLAPLPEVRDIETVRRDVRAREEQMSTGVGKGLALPHARSSAVRSTVVAFATTETAIEFDAIDRQPVQLIFLIVGPEAARGRHIKLLGRISRLMSRDAFREALLSAETAEQIVAHFAEAETALES